MRTRGKNFLKVAEMKEYIVRAKIRLEVEARNKDEAKEIAMEDLSDFLRHHSLGDLMEVREKKMRGQKT